MSEAYKLVIKLIKVRDKLDEITEKISKFSTMQAAIHAKTDPMWHRIQDLRSKISESTATEIDRDKLRKEADEYDKLNTEWYDLCDKIDDLYSKHGRNGEKQYKIRTALFNARNEIDFDTHWNRWFDAWAKRVESYDKYKNVQDQEIGSVVRTDAFKKYSDDADILEINESQLTHAVKRAILVPSMN